MSATTSLYIPSELARLFRAKLKSRARTVYDARRMLRSCKGKLFEFVVDDGVYSDRNLWGRYEDVVHSPETGFQLVLRGLQARKDRASRKENRKHRERSLLPLSVISVLPPEFAFLRDSPEKWELPDRWVACFSEGCGFQHNTGRFCVQCGSMVRRGSGWMGEGYSAMQLAIRELAHKDAAETRGCGCGGWVHAWERFCAKCGHRCGRWV